MDSTIAAAAAPVSDAARPGLRARLAGAGLLGLAAPKLCCLLPVLLTSMPTLLASLSLYGAGETFHSLDTMCTPAGTLPALVNLPLGVALAVMTAGVTLLALSLYRRRRAGLRY